MDEFNIEEGLLNSNPYFPTQKSGSWEKWNQNAFKGKVNYEDLENEREDGYYDENEEE